MNKRIVPFLRAHAVRILAGVAAAAPVLSQVTSHLPWEICVSLSAALITAGEYAQRMENDKTLRALLTTPQHPSKDA